MFEIADELEKEMLIQKYMYKYTWLSGSSTIVYPITIYEDNRENTFRITIQIKTQRNYFKSLLDRYKNKYKNYLYGYFSKNDDTCPSELVLVFNK